MKENNEKKEITTSSMKQVGGTGSSILNSLLTGSAVAATATRAYNVAESYISNMKTVNKYHTYLDENMKENYSLLKKFENLGVNNNSANIINKLHVFSVNDKSPEYNFLAKNLSIADYIFLFGIPAKILSQSDEGKTNNKFLLDSNFYGQNNKCYVELIQDTTNNIIIRVTSSLATRLHRESPYSIFNITNFIDKQKQFYFNTNVESFQDLRTTSFEPAPVVLNFILSRLLKNTLFVEKSLKVTDKITNFVFNSPDMDRFTNLYLKWEDKSKNYFATNTPKQNANYIYENDILSIKVTLTLEIPTDKNPKNTTSVTLVYHIINRVNILQSNDYSVSILPNNLQEIGTSQSKHTDHQLFFCQYVNNANDELNKLRLQYMKHLKQMISMDYFTDENKKEFKQLGEKKKREVNVEYNNVKTMTDDFVKLMDNLKDADEDKRKEIYKKLENSQNHHFHMASTNQLLMKLSANRNNDYKPYLSHMFPIVRHPYTNTFPTPARRPLPPPPPPRTFSRASSSGGSSSSSSSSNYYHKHVLRPIYQTRRSTKVKGRKMNKKLSMKKRKTKK